VIHQPRYSIFQMFDQVLLLGVGGNTVFQGSSEAALPYFQRLGFMVPPRDNPADVFMDIIAAASSAATLPPVAWWPSRRRTSSASGRNLPRPTPSLRMT